MREQMVDGFVITTTVERDKRGRKVLRRKIVAGPERQAAKAARAGAADGKTKPGGRSRAEAGAGSAGTED